MLWGVGGWFGGVEDLGLRVIFGLPGMVLATVFVTLPFIVREVEPVLEEIGEEQEEAAATLGAAAWQTFARITLPAIRWGLVYGVILTVARAGGVRCRDPGVVGLPRHLTDPDPAGPFPLHRRLQRVRCLPLRPWTTSRSRFRKVRSRRCSGRPDPGKAVRPHDLRLERVRREGALVAEVVRVVFLGFEVRVELKEPGAENIFVAEITRGDAAALRLNVGDEIYVRPLRIADVEVADVEEAPKAQNAAAGDPA